MKSGTIIVVALGLVAVSIGAVMVLKPSPVAKATQPPTSGFGGLLNSITGLATSIVSPKPTTPSQVASAGGYYSSTPVLTNNQYSSPNSFAATGMDANGNPVAAGSATDITQYQ